MSNSEVVKHSHFNKDRISVFIKRGVNVAQYENFDISLGYDTDKKPDETVEEAFRRTEGIVEGEIERILDKIDSGKMKATRKVKK
jgi:hypothetical protein